MASFTENIPTSKPIPPPRPWSAPLTRLLIVATVQGTLSGFLRPYAEHFRARGWTVDALAKGATGDASCREAFDHCFEADWSRNPLNQKGMFQAPARLRALVAEGAYDLVHVHTPVAAFLSRFALRRMRLEKGCKVVYTAHGFHFHDGRGLLGNALFAAAERLAGRWTDRLVVINRTDERAALRLGIVDASRLRYMPGIGLDPAQYDPAAVSREEVEAVRRGLGLEAGQPLFLMAAEFNPGKRHRDLLAAFASLEDSSAHLAFAGKGPEMEGLQRWCAEKGLGERVHFLGRRRDVPVLLGASLATVLPSEREGLSRSVMESMAMGIPVIGSMARGVRDLLEDCGGLLVPVGDTAALKEAMSSLIRDPDAARRMGEEARSRMGKYHISNLLRLHEELYAELLGSER